MSKLKARRSANAWNRAAAGLRRLQRTLPVPPAEHADQRDRPLPWPAYLPANYIEEPRLRIQAYRQLSGVARQSELDALSEGWRDRFGPLPKPTDNLLALSRLKLAAAERRIEQIETQGYKLMLTRRGELIQLDDKFPRLTSSKPASKMREIAAFVQTL